MNTEESRQPKKQKKIIRWLLGLMVVCGLLIGRKFGTKLAGKASILGGIILIAIGIEIFVTGVF